MKKLFRFTAWFFSFSLATSIVAAKTMADSESPAQFSHLELPAPTGKINHGQGLVELPGGDLLLCWYSGTTETNRDAQILCSRSPDRGQNWSQPTITVDRQEKARGADEPNKSVGNVSFSFDQSGRLWMIYGVVQEYRVPILGNLCTNWRCGRVDAKVSEDFGQTWSQALRLDSQAGSLARGKPLHSQRGEIVPLYLESEQTSFVRITRLELSCGDSRCPLPSGEVSGIPSSGLIQPSLVETPDGKIRAYLRSTRHDQIHVATLNPRDMSWSVPVPTNLPNPDAAVDAWTDARGRIVLVYNPSHEDRKTLRIAVSEDGTKFKEGCDLVANGALGDVAYPYVISNRDGDYSITFSSHQKTRIHYIRFNQAWLDKCI